MSDEQQPSFLRGLPPRGAQAPSLAASRDTAAATEASPARLWKPNKLTIIVVASFGLLLGTLLIVGLSLSGGSSNSGDVVGGPASGGVPASDGRAEGPAPEGSATPVDAPASVEGHVVSAEFCVALQSAVTLSEGALTTTAVTPELLAAYSAVAAIESPNQASYTTFVSLLVTPEAFPSDAEAQAAAAAFVTAAQADVATCS